LVHYQQDDRVFVSQGTLKIVLYDPRETSPTYGMLSELCVSEHNRGLLLIPRGVYHALQNVGTTDVMFINMPTRAYNHADLCLLAQPSGDLVQHPQRRVLKGASFTSPQQEREAIDRFVAAHNEEAAPFQWTKRPVSSKELQCIIR
jgi:hypothetical protein